MRLQFLFFCCLFSLIGNGLFAQNKHFVRSGIIEYERTVNMFALVKKKVTRTTMENKPYYEEYLKTEPQFRKMKSTLTFGPGTTLFNPLPADEVDWRYNTSMANQLNIVFSDLKNGSSTVQKEFYERTYLVKDAIRKIRWKMTDETRMIAGYNCRRANALVLDSIYVVAFYTDEIHVSGGPESFNGLPGMILGVAVPYENVTWFATKVTETVVDPKTITPPKKGKVVNNQEVQNEIQKAIVIHGDYAITVLKGLLL